MPLVQYGILIEGTDPIQFNYPARTAFQNNFDALDFLILALVCARLSIFTCTNFRNYFRDQNIFNIC